MESFCLFKVGFKSLMNSISNIRQSHLVLHFLKILRSLERLEMSLPCVRMCSPMAVLPRVGRLFGVGVGLYSRHKQPRTGHIRNGRRLSVCLPGQVFVPQFSNHRLICDW